MGTVLAGVHPVLEALRAGRPIERILIARGASTSRLQEILDRSRAAGIPLRFQARQVLDRMSGPTPHQGVVAVAAAHHYAAFEDLIPRSRLLVALDGVEDPHNLGAIIRTAHAAGADGLVVPERRSAGLSPVVAKAAAGALEYLPVARVVNLSRALDRLKESGYWVYGLDERGEHVYDRLQYAERAAFVLGAEGRGLHEHVRTRCDFLVRIPCRGPIGSLNVSVAAGIVLFEWRRQRAESE
ncbi:MAG: 23S rRNA (guanosine(2251)-2'-O)-methyltransferase RlmB [Bryobacterales bacterium]|nr:23S rRNA (guanosine(2251)-2'-O)-methyltransferase RlmB [Bryobacteraceae bacterium]MDW8356132.1 23S rRNA (guanosine(2251)-2'-O)-methyltransferase RlmB [Bryobacterales bacterium]